MRYGYKCACGNTWTVIKSVKMIDREEKCPGCDEIGWRYISRTHFYGASDWNSDEYQKINAGFGCRVHNKAHKRELCRKYGVEEVGNDFKTGAEMQKHDDTRREAELAARYDDI